MTCGEREGVTSERFALGSKLKRVASITLPPPHYIRDKSYLWIRLWVDTDSERLDKDRSPRNRTQFSRSNIIKHNCFLYNSVWNIFHSRNQRDSTIKVNSFLDRVPVIHFRFQSNLNFLDRFSKKKIQISNLMKIHRQLRCSMPVNRQSDRRIGMTTLRVAVEILRTRLKRVGSNCSERCTRGWLWLC